MSDFQQTLNVINTKTFPASRLATEIRPVCAGRNALQYLWATGAFVHAAGAVRAWPVRPWFSYGHENRAGVCECAWKLGKCVSYIRAGQVSAWSAATLRSDGLLSILVRIDPLRAKVAADWNNQLGRLARFVCNLILILIASFRLKKVPVSRGAATW